MRERNVKFKTEIERLTLKTQELEASVQKQKDKNFGLLGDMLEGSSDIMNSGRPLISDDHEEANRRSKKRKLEDISKPQ